MLPDDAVHEYQQIYKKVYGQEVDFPSAQIMASKFLDLVFLIEHPIGNENEKFYENPQRAA